MSHADILRNKTAAGTLETVVRRILRTFDQATPGDVEAGASWYPTARIHAEAIGSKLGGVAYGAVVLAHLSPRTDWDRNVAGAYALANGDEDTRGMIGDNCERAFASLDFVDPLDSFGPKALKTASFARNILGDEEAVTVDVWAARVAGVDEERELKRVGVYDAVAHAYRVAARRRGVSPRTMQATTWTIARNGRG